MIGTWSPVFGFYSLGISDVACQIGFNPAMCGVSFCLSDIGIGATLRFGTRVVEFYGNVAFPDYEDIFLKGKLSTVNNTGLVFSVADIFHLWNGLFPKFKVANIPELGIKEVGFSLATSAGSFQNIQYNTGLLVEGTIDIFGVFATLSVKADTTNSSTPNFKFQFKINNVDFNNKMLVHVTNKLVQILKFAEEECRKIALKIYHFEIAAINDFSAVEAWSGEQLTFQSTLSVLGIKRNLKKYCTWAYLENQFKVIFHELFSAFFDIDWKICVTSKTCPTGWICHRIHCIPDIFSDTDVAILN